MTQLTQIQQAKQLNENDRVITKGLVTASAVRETASGKAYTDFTISDKHGSISVKKWGSSAAPELNTVVEVDGKINVWQDTKSINASSWVVAPEEDIGQFVESSHAAPEDLLEEVYNYVGTYCASNVAHLVHKILENYQDELMDSPAARGNHHARRGGLLEHTFSMLRLAEKIVPHYELIYNIKLNMSLLVAGIVLHDIGKIKELSGSQGTEYTTTGRLVGHIPHGVLILQHALINTDVYKEEADQLYHMILSHHGQLAWGSPVVPQTPEAIILHQLDMIDSRMDAVATAMRQNEGEEWTPFIKSLGASIYLGDK